MVSRRTLIKGAVGSAALAAPVLSASRSVFAQDASPEASPAAVGGPPPLPEGCELLAAGLNSPRYLAVADDGSIYVTEAGVGGDEPIVLDLEGGGDEEGTPVAGTPVAAEPTSSRGDTGQVTKIAPDGTVSVAASGLSSYLIGGLEATGPAGIVLSGGLIWVSIGGPGPGLGSMDPLEYENSVVSIDEASGTTTKVADIGANELANNPEPTHVDSNVYGMGLASDGMLYVADAGGNAVYRVDPASGDLSVAAVLPPIDNATGFGPPVLEPVPTGIAPNSAGGVFVSLLSGGPFPPGATLIQAIAEDGTVSTVAGGLTMCTDVAVGPDGHLYAVQLSLDFTSDPPGPGSVVRVLEDGTLEPVVEGLMLPNGIAFDADGNLLIAAGAVTPPGMDPIGMVLRCSGVAAA